MAERGGIWSVLQERDKWLKKRDKIQLKMKEILGEEKYIMEELEKVKQQIAYYDSLIKDMKKELQPPEVKSLLESLINF